MRFVPLARSIAIRHIDLTDEADEKKSRRARVGTFDAITQS
jgi:hypothetical protein